MKFSQAALLVATLAGTVQGELVVPDSLELKVKVLKGKACKADRDYWGRANKAKSDAFVKVYWEKDGKKNYCGVTYHKGNAEWPTWNQVISCKKITKAQWGNGIKIYLEMYDYDSFSAAENLGGNTHSEVFSYGEHSAGKLTMTSLKGSVCGGGNYIEFETLTPMTTYKYCYKCPSVHDFASLSIYDDYHHISEELEQKKKGGGLVGVPGDVLTLGDGSQVKLEANCGAKTYEEVTICTKKDDCGTGVIYGKVVVDKDHADKEKADLKALGFVLFYPGEIIPYLDGKGLVEKDCSITPETPSSYGDPHFKTWAGDVYDFHGGCDLVLLENPAFAHGLGMNIHVRTKIQTWWSHIESAAIQIGDNTLQVTGSKTTSIRYVLNNEEKELETGDAYLGDYAIHFRRVNDHQTQTRVDLGNRGDAIGIETYKHFVRVNVNNKMGEAFADSKGLLGQYPTGQMIGRDGQTVFEDANQFGQEWMVRPTDTILFKGVNAADLPLQCAMPDQTQKQDKARRLGESMITEKDAALACARVSESDRDACIFDVMSTQDKDIAGSY